MLPLHGLRVVVVTTDVAHELASEVFHAGEHPTSDHVTFDFGKPKLDLVQPGRVGRSEVQLHLGMFSEKLLDLLGLVRREIVQDHMDLFLLRLVRDEITQERDEFRRGVPGSGLAEHRSGPRIKGGVEGERAVAKVLKSMSFCTAGRQRQYGVHAIQRLDRGLLIDAEYRGMLRRVQIPPDDVGGLAFEIRIVRGHVALESMGFEPMFSPNPRHHHVRKPEMLAEPTRAPMRAAVGGWSARCLKNPRLESRRELRGRLAAMPTEEPCKPLGRKAFRPASNVAVGAIQLQANLSPRRPFRHQQDTACSPRFIGPSPAARYATLQFHSLDFTQCHRTLPRCDDYTTVSVVTIHYCRR